MTCITQRTYEEGDWIITETITFVVGNQVNEFIPNGKTDTGWLITVDGTRKYRTYVVPNATCDNTLCCFSAVSISGEF